MKQLLLMRHAKSDWDADYSRDHDRPLNDRGVRSARLMGRFLAAHDLAPGLVISSTAQRARSTAQLAAEAGGWDAEIDLQLGFYEAGPEGVVEIAAKAPDVHRLMLIGHQPTWSGVVSSITGTRVDIKTASVAVIELEIDSWSSLKTARGRLADVHNPRSYFGTEWDRQ